MADPRLTLYKLKRQLGKPINICRRLEDEVDRTSGMKTLVLDSREVRQAIPLPITFDRQFVYNLTWIASNKNFSYGAIFPNQSMRFLIDKVDLPDFEIKVGDYIISKGRRFDVEVVEDFPDIPCYDITAKASSLAALENLVRKAAYSVLYFEDEAVAVL